MAGTFNIPLTTLVPGVHNFPASGGAAVADSDSLALLTIDRTVPGGLNAVPAVSFEVSVYQSNDGGATWQFLASAGGSGGISIMHGGQQVNSNDIGVSLWPGTSRLVRASVTITGASVAVAGTLAIS
jgi:hypothetical protein